MLAFTLKKFYVSLVTLLGVSLIAFVLMRIVPGDTIVSQLGQYYTPEQAATLREDLGLDRPVLVQYGWWLSAAVRGDFGYSRVLSAPVAEGVLSHLPVTLELAAFSLVYALLLGIPLGIVAAVRQGGVWDYICSSVGVLGVSVPNFWLATMLILLFSLVLGWFPSSVGELPGLLENPLANLRAMVMPTVALGSAVAAVIMRMTRSSMLEVLGQDYVRTARAKGLMPWKVVTKHALRNALVPVLTVTGIQAGYLLGGAVVIEMVFTLPGIGWLVYESASRRDYFLLQAVILLIATAFIAVNLVVDLLYGVLDPRMRKTG